MTPSSVEVESVEDVVSVVDVDVGEVVEDVVEMVVVGEVIDDVVEVADNIFVVVVVATEEAVTITEEVEMLVEYTLCV